MYLYLPISTPDTVFASRRYHSPTGTLGAEVDLAHDNERRDRSGRHHPAPLCVLSEDSRPLMKRSQA
jgi:hypothetical protein